MLNHLESYQCKHRSASILFGYCDRNRNSPILSQNDAHLHRRVLHHYSIHFFFAWSDLLVSTIRPLASSTGVHSQPEQELHPNPTLGPPDDFMLDNGQGAHFSRRCRDSQGDEGFARVRAGLLACVCTMKVENGEKSRRMAPQQARELADRLEQRQQVQEEERLDQLVNSTAIVQCRDQTVKPRGRGQGAAVFLFYFGDMLFSAASALLARQVVRELHRLFVVPRGGRFACPSCARRFSTKLGRIYHEETRCCRDPPRDLNQWFCASLQVGFFIADFALEILKATHTPGDKPVDLVDPSALPIAHANATGGAAYIYGMLDKERVKSRPARTSDNAKDLWQMVKWRRYCMTSDGHATHHIPPHINNINYLQCLEFLRPPEEWPENVRELLESVVRRTAR